MGRIELLARFSSFDGGEYGALAARRAAPNQFTGYNAMVYRDGSIGPRAGIKDLSMVWATTGMPEIVGFHGNSQSGGRDRFYFVSGTTLYRVDVRDSTGGLLTGQTPASVGTFSGSGAGQFIQADRRYSYVTMVNASTYQVDNGVASPTMTALTGAPGGRCTAIYGEQMVVAAPTGNTNRIRWSAPANYNSWPSTNFLDVGSSNETITAMRVMRNQLVLLTDQGSIFIVSGVLGVNHTVREFLPGERVGGPGHAGAVDMDRAGNLWYTRETSGELAVPVMFTGSERVEFPMVGNLLVARDSAVTARGETRNYVATLHEQATVVIAGSPPGGGDYLVFRDGAWTAHASADLTDDGCAIVAGSSGEVYLLGRNGAAAPRLYVWKVEQNLPPTTVNSLSGLEDGTSTTVSVTFETQEVVSADGEELWVEWVDVAFTSVDTGLTLENRFGVYLKVQDVGHDPASSEVTAAPGEVVVGGWNDDPQTGRYRKSFGVAASAGRAFSLVFRDLRGVQIDDVLVFGTRQPARR